MQSKSSDSIKVPFAFKKDSVQPMGLTKTAPTEEVGWDFDFDDEESPVKSNGNVFSNLSLNQNALSVNNRPQSQSTNNTNPLLTTNSMKISQNGWAQWDEEW
jgi:hypothetical protein